MITLNRVAFIGNALPRRCGIATFTTDLQQAIANANPELDTCVVAMTDEGQVYDYPAVVARQVREERLTDYTEAADFLNAGQFDIVCLQHEFGIFGGEAGEHVVRLLQSLTMPVVTTLHTVLAEPSAKQKAVLRKVIEASAKVVVMADKARDLLLSDYGTPSHKIEVIPHGIPDFAFVEPDAAKAALGFVGKSVILTFGLLSPNKGVETALSEQT